MAWHCAADRPIISAGVWVDVSLLMRSPSHFLGLAAREEGPHCLPVCVCPSVRERVSVSRLAQVLLCIRCCDVIFERLVCV